MSAMEFKAAAGGGFSGLPVWVHIAPLGEFPAASVSGFVQVVDRASVVAMVNRFQAEAQRPNFAGLLVDFDHFSADPAKSSEAAGWITELEGRADGLWAKVRWTRKGAAAVAGGDFRLVSPVLEDFTALGGGRHRPGRLAEVGLTNKPNMKGAKPMVNRAGAGPGGHAFSAVSPVRDAGLVFLTAAGGGQADPRLRVLNARRDFIERLPAGREKEARLVELRADFNAMAGVNGSSFSSPAAKPLVNPVPAQKPQTQAEWLDELMRSEIRNVMGGSVRIAALRKRVLMGYDIPEGPRRDKHLKMVAEELDLLKKQARMPKVFPAPPK